VFVVVAVAFAVGGDVGELGFAGVGVEAGEEAAGEVFSAAEEAFEGDGAGVGAVVEEDGDAAAFVELDGLGVGGVYGGVGGFGPLDDRGFCGFGGHGFLFGDAADASALDGGEDGELDALLGEEIEDVTADGGL
jgi:hypothetical protein